MYVGISRRTPRARERDTRNKLRCSRNHHASEVVDVKLDHARSNAQARKSNRVDTQKVKGKGRIEEKTVE